MTRPRRALAGALVAAVIAGGVLAVVVGRGGAAALPSSLKHAKDVHAVVAQVQRGFGDFSAYLWVAEGQGEIALSTTVKAWDVAAIKAVVEEAHRRGKPARTSGASPASIQEGEIHA